MATDETRALVDEINALVETGTEEIERLRARVAELEEERLVKDEAEPKSVEEPAEWAWYYDGSRVQGDGFATREEAIRDAVIGHEAERFLVGPMRDLDLAEWVDAADIAERISESICDNLGLEDIRVYAGPAAQAALEAWARTNLSPDPSRYCEGEPVTMDEVRSTQKGGADG